MDSGYFELFFCLFLYTLQKKYFFINNIIGSVSNIYKLSYYFDYISHLKLDSINGIYLHIEKGLDPPQYFQINLIELC